MTLYIKEKVFSWSDRFSIKDEDGSDRWFAQGEIFSFGRKLRVFDASYDEAAFIRQKVFSFLPRYYIDIADQEYELVKEFSLLRPKYTLPDLGWTVSGEFLAHDYVVNDENDNEVMRMSKAWLTWGDFYELDITDPQNEIMCLCVALAIDCVVEDRAR